MGIKKSQFEELQKRLKSKLVRGNEVNSVAPRPFNPAAAVILGIDPSLRASGFGKIRMAGRTIKAIDYGVIECPKSWPKSRCLGAISLAMERLLAEDPPDCCVFEGLFYSQNLKTAIIMGEARGASLAAAGSRGIDSYELAPRKVKQALVGFGGAQKSAIAKMVQRLLSLDQEPMPDAADALAIAIAFAFEHSGVILHPPVRI